jgi:competence protein ComEA
MNALFRYPWLLRRADQPVVAVLAFSALALITVWRLSQAGGQNRLIEVQQAQQHAVRFQVDINTADWPELIQLPGIGNTLARRIVEFRQAHGPFSKTDDLIHIKGIGPVIMERLRPYLLPLPDDQKNDN